MVVLGRNGLPGHYKPMLAKISGHSLNTDRVWCSLDFGDRRSYAQNVKLLTSVHQTLYLMKNSFGARTARSQKSFRHLGILVPWSLLCIGSKCFCHIFLIHRLNSYTEKIFSWNVTEKFGKPRIERHFGIFFYHYFMNKREIRF